MKLSVKIILGCHVFILTDYGMLIACIYAISLQYFIYAIGDTNLTLS